MTTTEFSTLSLRDALPISYNKVVDHENALTDLFNKLDAQFKDRKSTRLNSSHRCISYAVFCLKKKNDGTQAAVTINKGEKSQIARADLVKGQVTKTSPKGD